MNGFLSTLIAYYVHSVTKFIPHFTQDWVNLIYLFLGSYFAIPHLDQFVLEELKKINFMNQIVFLENLSNKIQ